MDERLRLVETVQGTTVSPQGTNHVENVDGFAPGMFSVRNGVPEDIFHELFKDASCLLIDVTTDPLHSGTACKASDGGFGNSRDVVAQHFAVALRAALAETLSSFSTS